MKINTSKTKTMLSEEANQSAASSASVTGYWSKLTLLVI
jgi:hypothetical protein